jgi:hypothetical protein
MNRRRGLQKFEKLHRTVTRYEQEEGPANFETLHRTVTRYEQEERPTKV